MATISKPYTFSAGATIVAAEHNANFDTIYSEFCGSIDNTNIKASAGIVDTKLAAITSASKVNGSALYSLASMTSAAGLVPTINLGTGTTGSAVYLRGDGTWASVSTAGASIDASQVVSGVLSTARLATGTTSTSVYLRGDGTWASISTASNYFSNTVFCFGGCADSLYSVGSADVGKPTLNDAFWFNSTANYATVLRTKLKKIAGGNTITWYAYVGKGSISYIKIDIGGASSEAYTSSSTPVWLSNTIDISALTTGTVYDVVIQLKSSNSNYSAKLFSIIGFAS